MTNSDNNNYDIYRHSDNINLTFTNKPTLIYKPFLDKLTRRA